MGFQFFKVFGFFVPLFIEVKSAVNLDLNAVFAACGLGVAGDELDAFEGVVDGDAQAPIFPEFSQEMHKIA